MQAGMIGLGRMGFDMTRRLMRAGHALVVHDINPDAADRAAREGATGAATLADLVAAMARPRTCWLMLPAAVVDDTVVALSELLDPDDVIVDGGNSRYHDDIRRFRALSGKGLHYVDVGTSGGVWGLENGYCLMIGGEKHVVERLDPLFRALAPLVDAAPRTPGRAAVPSSAEHGYLHCGPAGAGHFVKMVHNGIEYGIMAAYAEGLNILEHANVGGRRRGADAETAPLDHPERFQFDLPIGEIAEVWRRGSVIRSWLLDLTAAAFVEDPALSDFEGRVSDSGEGRWTVEAAVEASVPAHVLTAALYERFDSRAEADFANRVLSAMRFGFGGHVEKKERRRAGR